MEKLSIHFYLTGGTALTRTYFQHRHSDDLDFANDINTHFGDIVKTELFSRTDSIKNGELVVEE